MVVLNFGPRGKYFMDGYLKENLDVFKNNLKKDFDCFLVVSGRERYGKSTLAGQIALYLDPSYNLSRCVFTPDQFHECIEKSKKYQAVVFDEAHGALNAKESMSSVNKKLTQTMTEMGFRNLIVILVLPSFFDLGKYPAIHRSNCLIHVHDRGSFLYFSFKRKKRLYLKGKRFYQLSEKSNFRGRFPKFSAYDMDEYVNKKKQSVSVAHLLSDKDLTQIEQRNKAIRALREETSMTHQQISEIVGLSRRYVSEILENKRHMVGGDGEIVINTNNEQGNVPIPIQKPSSNNAI